MKRINLLSTLLSLVISTAAFVEKVVVLEDPKLARSSRASLILGAEESIDAMYFAIDNDDLSLKAIALLSEAARKGITVRLIVDSMHNALTRPVIAAAMNTLEADKKKFFQIKEFNQFNLFKLFCYQKRMHDKSLIIDGKYLIVGDRNVANGYFDLAAKDKDGGSMPLYQGMDVLIEGEKTSSMASKYFQDRWDSADVAEPRLYEFSRENLDPMACAYNYDTQDSCEASRKRAVSIVSAEIKKLKDLHTSTVQDLDLNQMKAFRTNLIATGIETDDVEFLHDDVKGRAFCKGKPDNNIGKRLYEIINQSTDQNLLVVTPYLVVTPEMQKLVQGLTDRGVDSKFVTNSLVANDVASAHQGYLKTRHLLYDVGARIFEFNDVSEDVGDLETLHAKMVLMDDKKLFIGSYNWDYRSQNINSEVGVVIGINPKQSQLINHIRSAMNDVLKSAYEVEESGDKVRSSYRRPAVSTEQQEAIKVVIAARKASNQFWKTLLKSPFGNFLLKLL